jgi:uncharacterized protein with GYD domain
MATYILMTKLSCELHGDPRGRRAIGREWKKRVTKLCPEVEFISHYALLGQYDFMDVYRAPSDEVAMKISLISRSLGAVAAESWPAVPYEQWVDISSEVERAVEEH